MSDSPISYLASLSNLPNFRRRFPPAALVSFGMISALLSTPAYAAITANDDVRQVPQGVAVVIDVLANDVSTEPGLSIASFGQPSSGTVTDEGGALRYAPEQGFTGSDSFTYAIQNNAGEQATATVTVSVQTIDEVAEVSTIEDAAPRAATTIMRSHREAVSLFLNTGSFASLNGRATTSDSDDGGGAGDGNFKLGGVFLSINHRGGDQEAKGEQLAYDEDLTGFTLGGDIAWGPNWTAGAAVGASQTTIDFADGKGDFNVDDISILGFAGYRSDRFSFQTQMGYAVLDYAFNRAQSEGNNLFGFAKAQYVWQRQAWQVSPAFTLNYQNHFVEAYLEEGDNPSSFSSQKNRALQAGFNLNIDRAINFSWGVLLPRFAVNYERIINSGQQGISGFAGGQTFELIGDEGDKDQILVELGTSAVLPRGLSFFGNVQSFLEQEGYSSTTLQLGLRKEI